ncbi:CDP-alcohol phosphatidyltransferase family protein [Nocardiopsis sp. NPDC058631]|uniref:CDP-alcohol phosphatidyltransferase family protein n=1 Tax=Nocardiopsis sp. NPDC058631 TaxID=3346566 RepID=UPI00364FB5DB
MGDPAAFGAAACAQVSLLALLGSAVGLGPAGWAAGAVYLLAGTAVLVWAARRSGRERLGPADRVTLARAVLVGGVVALVADGGPAWPLVALASVALALDLVDGLVARGTRTESPFGARFDMEVDAFLILVLSVRVASELGWWVLAIGAMRYLFVAAAQAAPWLGGPLPPSQARKAVAVVQGVALVVAAAPGVPVWAAVAVVSAALVSLTWSFGRDAVGLWRSGPGRAGTGAVGPRADTRHGGGA